jgi:cytochrome c556
MKLVKRLGLLLIGLSLASPGFAAQDPNEKAIKARQGEMQLRSFNAGPLFGMAKGDIEYDAELATTLAGNLKLMLDLDNGRAWPTGSDNGMYDSTTALPKIWETFPEIGEYGKRYKTAVNELAAVAGDGVDALRSKVGALGKSCKGCHDEFREKN